MSAAGRWVVVTGARDISPADVLSVQMVVAQAARDGALGFVFGGARGVDTVALHAAHHAGARRLVVIVPGTVQQQPLEAQKAIQALASEVIAMGLPLDRPRSFQQRNEHMLTTGMLRDPNESPLVLAFPLAQTLKGGTRNCMLAARSRGLEVEAIDLTGRVEKGGVD